MKNKIRTTQRKPPVSKMALQILTSLKNAVANELKRKRLLGGHAVFSRNGVIHIVDYKSGKVKEKILNNLSNTF